MDVRLKIRSFIFLLIEAHLFMFSPRFWIGFWKEKNIELPKIVSYRGFSCLSLSLEWAVSGLTRIYMRSFYQFHLGYGMLSLIWVSLFADSAILVPNRFEFPALFAFSFCIFFRDWFLFFAAWTTNLASLAESKKLETVNNYLAVFLLISLE